MKPKFRNWKEFIVLGMRYTLHEMSLSETEELVAMQVDELGQGGGMVYSTRWIQKTMLCRLLSELAYSSTLLA